MDASIKFSNGQITSSSDKEGKSNTENNLI